MIGLDRAAVWVSLADVDPDLVILGVQKRFANVQPRKLAGTTQSFAIKSENINEIRVTEKTGKTLVKIDFSYARFKDDNNFYPLTTELGKELVEYDLINIIKDISLTKVTRQQLNYEYLEICLQEKIKTFYEWHNIISLFYRAIKRNNYTKIGTCFEDYDYQSDFYYNTGFIFQMNQSWKMRLYSKSHEHNKKNQEKIKGASLRLEHRMSKQILEYYCGTTIASNITLQIIKEKIISRIAKTLFKHLKSELDRDISILEKEFKGYRSRDIETLIRDNQNYILDEKVVNQIITSLSEKSNRQTIRYREKAKEALKKFEARGSPKRANFNNIERLETFLKKLLYVNKKVKCSYKERLTFNDV